MTADREATAEVEEVRKMLIMDFAGFPGQHYIGSAERIVEFLRASRQERPPGCTCPTTIGGDRVENLSCPTHGERPPGDRDGLAPWELEKSLRTLDRAYAQHADGRRISPAGVALCEMERLRDHYRLRPFASSEEQRPCTCIDHADDSGVEERPDWMPPSEQPGLGDLQQPWASMDRINQMLTEDGWRKGADGLWRNDRLGGAYKPENAVQRIGSQAGEDLSDELIDDAKRGLEEMERGDLIPAGDVVPADGLGDLQLTAEDAGELHDLLKTIAEANAGPLRQPEHAAISGAYVRFGPALRRLASRENPDG